MLTKDSKAWGTDPFWQLWVTDPVAEDDSLNISSRTMLAVRSRHKALSSFSPGKAREISDPMSSSNASKTSLPLMWAVNPGIASISFPFRRVECISGFSSVTPWSFSLLENPFLKSDSLKTVVRGSSVLKLFVFRKSIPPAQYYGTYIGRFLVIIVPYHAVVRSCIVLPNNWPQGPPCHLYLV